jgi:hypothetical protein
MSVPDRWEIIQVRLYEPLRAMRAPPHSTGANLTFWWKDTPLGRALVHAGEFPLNQANLQQRAVRAIAPAVGSYSFENGFKPVLPVWRQNVRYDVSPNPDSLAALSQPLEKIGINVSEARRETSVWVIVCTRRRPEELRRCLVALQRLDPAPSEIIVVHNAPDERSTRNVVEEFDGVMTGLVLATELETESQVRFEFVRSSTWQTNASLTVPTSRGLTFRVCG